MRERPAVATWPRPGVVGAAAKTADRSLQAAASGASLPSKAESSAFDCWAPEAPSAPRVGANDSARALSSP